MMPTTDMIGYSKGVGAIADAFTGYMAGQMEKNAYMHKAAMAELQAKQIGINNQFIMADKTEELAQTLAMQNVMAAATGRKAGAGSMSNLTQTSIKNLQEEEQRMNRTADAKKVGLLMEGAGYRASGDFAATSGLIGAFSGLGSDLYEASEYMTPKG